MLPKRRTSHIQPLGTSTKNKEMKISPKYYNTDWNSLNLTRSYSPDWVKGAEIVHNRIHGR